MIRVRVRVKDKGRVGVKVRVSIVREQRGLGRGEARFGGRLGP